MAWETKHEDTKEVNVQLGNVASRVTICGTVTFDVLFVGLTSL